MKSGRPQGYPQDKDWWGAPVRHPSVIGGATYRMVRACPATNKMLMVWVFDLSWSFDLFALASTWEKLWVLSVVVSAETLRTSAKEPRAPDWTGTHRACELRGARSASGRISTVQECKG